jgi:hypothetical protein
VRSCLDALCLSDEPVFLGWIQDRRQISVGFWEPKVQDLRGDPKQLFGALSPIAPKLELKVAGGLGLHFDARLPDRVHQVDQFNVPATDSGLDGTACCLQSANPGPQQFGLGSGFNESPKPL